MSQIFINTYSGKRLDFIEQKAESVCIDDIAYALSNLCRFCGHPGPFFTVCHHSMIVSDLLSGTRLKTLGLLHDAHEAYIGEILKPTAVWLNILDGGRFKKALKTAKHLVDRTIFEHLKIDLPSEEEQKIIKIADDMSFEMERDAFGFGDKSDIAKGQESLGRYLLMHKHTALQTYLEKFNSLVEV